MKSFWFQIIGLMVVIVVITFLTFNRQYLAAFTGYVAKPNTIQQVQTTTPDSLKITSSDGIEKARLIIEVANDKEKRSKGLGFRESLATDSGMLFIHDNSQKYTYWMKGMQFPIDIMWIKGDTIMDIIPNIPPPLEGQGDETLERYSSTVEVDRVLETNAGFVLENNIQKGDKIVLDP